MEYKKILLIRTDRIGDLLLTTPAIEAVREKFPYAHIAVMVQPYAEEIVDGNPYIDEIIIYDKDNKHKTWLASFLFAQKLKKKNFDAAVIFHPINRAHIITYLASIPIRVGYDRNFGFLLTDKAPHTKHLGQMHEVDYTIDLLKRLGVDGVKKREPYMPIKAQSENYINSLFIKEGIGLHDKIAVFHPGASCDSKIWPSERFAKLADRLIDDFKVKVVIVSGKTQKDIACVNKMENFMNNKSISFAGRLTLSELASCFKRSAILISNDSGPVHIACALGIPVIAIFGRGQPGLSPKRWGPFSKKGIVLHKDACCGENCLAHNCKKGFACLAAITADEVYEAASSILC